MDTGKNPMVPLDDLVVTSGEEEKYVVKYQRKRELKVLTATFDDEDSAQMFWDGLAYLRSFYEWPLSPRP